MNGPTVPLTAEPQMSGYLKIFEAAKKPCGCEPDVLECYRIARRAGCTEGVKICRPCAARAILNGLTSLAEKL